ncbi:MAG: hypothetical protein R3A47_12215 [Polyangiales bacterium]
MPRTRVADGFPGNLGLQPENYPSPNLDAPRFALDTILDYRVRRTRGKESNRYSDEQSNIAPGTHRNAWLQTNSIFYNATFRPSQQGKSNELRS